LLLARSERVNVADHLLLIGGEAADALLLKLKRYFF
jgi:hypothetical protein